jgi:transcriptional regulator with XRE-family HTH domain
MYYAIGTRMKLFRDAKGISRRIMADLLVITPQKLSLFENNRTEIPSEIVTRFATIVNTTVYNLVGPYSEVEIKPYNTDCLLDGNCICGYPFKKNFNNDLDKKHIEQHEWFLRFSDYFGYQSSTDNEIHINFHKAIDPENNLTLAERLNAVEEYVNWYYLRSARRFNEKDWHKHPKFSDYMAMSLHQQIPDSLHKMPFDMYQILVGKYGTKAGIKEGSSYFKID